VVALGTGVGAAALSAESGRVATVMAVDAEDIEEKDLIIDRGFLSG